MTRTGKLVDRDRLARLAGARAFNCEVYDKPDTTLTDTAGRVRVSVVIAGGFFVLGEYLDAWDARQAGRPYCCYALNREDARVLAGP